jgi:hypothetical protein
VSRHQSEAFERNQRTRSQIQRAAGILRASASTSFSFSDATATTAYARRPGSFLRRSRARVSPTLAKRQGATCRTATGRAACVFTRRALYVYPDAMHGFICFARSFSPSSFHLLKKTSKAAVAGRAVVYVFTSCHARGGRSSTNFFGRRRFSIGRRVRVFPTPLPQAYSFRLEAPTAG